MSVKHTTFRVEKYPQPVLLEDVRECFVALADYMGYDRKAYVITLGHGIEIWTKDSLFEKLFKVIYSNEKLFPIERHSRTEEIAPLPNLFISAEKTQIRQIPLVEHPPWPFKFLLELGGMIVVRPKDERDMLLELKQFVNNHPQFRLKVDAKKWPDGKIAIFTWWFEKLPKHERKKNLNVGSS